MHKIQTPKTSKRLPIFVEQEKMIRLFDNLEWGNSFRDKQSKHI